MNSECSGICLNIEKAIYLEVPVYIRTFRDMEFECSTTCLNIEQGTMLKSMVYMDIGKHKTWMFQCLLKTLNAVGYQIPRAC